MEAGSLMAGFELSVQGGSTAASVRIVDDVIVDERGSVEQFERSGCLSQADGDIGRCAGR